MAVALALTFTVASCQGLAGSSAYQEPTIEAVDEIEARMSTIVAVPINTPREPESFPASDADFLRAAEHYFDVSHKTPTASDDQLVEWARQFCSVVSGGGLLASKVDGWAGASRIPEELAVPIFMAAMDVYCIEYAQGYVNIRAGRRIDTPTSAEKADLIRFVTGLPKTVGAPELGTMSNEEIHSRALRLCAVSSLRLVSLPGTFLRGLVRGVPPRSQTAFVSGLVVAQCPSRSPELFAWLSAQGDA